MIKKLKGIAVDIIAIVGAVLISIGCEKIFNPLGYITLGLFLISYAVIISKS